jgi:hypothetical protein
MNSTPADSNARRIAKSLALVSAVWFSFSSARRMVATHALEFPDGKVILLNHLLEDQKAVVLQLPGRPATASEAESQKRVVHVG